MHDIRLTYELRELPEDDNRLHAAVLKKLNESTVVAHEKIDLATTCHDPDVLQDAEHSITRLRVPAPKIVCNKHVYFSSKENARFYITIQMATKIDPRRDIWGALIGEAQASTTSLGSKDKHFLFVGSEKCGKSSLQNSFFGRSDEPPATLALGYQSCLLHSQDCDQLLHFWELGAGKGLEKILDTIVTKDNMPNFVIFICFNLTKASTIVEATEWLPLVMRRFKSGCLNAFLVGTHYDKFEDRDPSQKAVILNGLRALGYQYGAGVLTYSSKIDALASRFKTLVKALAMPGVKRPEKVTTHLLPMLIYRGEDDEHGGSDIANKFLSTIKDEAEKEKEKNLEASGTPETDVSKAPIFAEEEIDKLIQTKERDLEDRLRALRATITD